MLFSIQIQIKKYWKINFFSFWQDLGFCELFFNSNEKSIEILFFAVFGKIFGFGEYFFLFKFEFKKYWKLTFFSFSQDLGFSEGFFLFKF